MKSLLKVSLPDGRIIQEAKPTDTFVSSICELGLEEVNASGYMANKKSGVPLVGKDKETYTSQVDGWYIYTHWDVNKMAAILNTLAGQLEFDLKAEVVSSDLPDRKVSSDRRILIEIEGKSYAEKFKKVICLLGVERDVVVEQGDFIAAGDKIVHDDLAEIVGAVFVALFVKAEVVDGLVFAVKGIEIERRGDGIYLLRQEEGVIAVGLR